jgi:hypothetical protein
MAPERKPRENQYLFDLGVKGRQVDPSLSLRKAHCSPGKPASHSQILGFEMRMV